MPSTPRGARPAWNIPAEAASDPVVLASYLTALAVGGVVLFILCLFGWLWLLFGCRSCCGGGGRRGHQPQRSKRPKAKPPARKTTSTARAAHPLESSPLQEGDMDAF